MYDVYDVAHVPNEYNVKRWTKQKKKRKTRKEKKKNTKLKHKLKK